MLFKRERPCKMKLKEGLSPDFIYLPKKIWNALGWNIDDNLNVKIKNINDANTVIITRENE